MSIQTNHEFVTIRNQMMQDGYSLAQMAVLRDRLRATPHGPINIQAVGYLASSHPMRPQFVYVVDTAGRIWLLDDANEAYVMNMLVVAHGGGLRPFPVTGTVLPDGRLVVPAHAAWQ